MTTTVAIEFKTSYNGFVSSIPQINLETTTFESICDIARSQYKRELVKSEREKLLREYRKACNRQQLFLLPDQTRPPFRVCPGDVWMQTEGSLINFNRLIDNYLNRRVTAEEWDYLKQQYSKAGRDTRQAPQGIGMSWREGVAKLKAMALGNMDRVGKNGHYKTGLFLDPLVKEGVIPKDYSRSFGFDKVHTFNYRAMKADLKSKLHSKRLDHKTYNEELKKLRQMRDAILHDIEEGYAKALRNVHNNSSHFHIGIAAKGKAPDQSGYSKRYAKDGY